MRSSPRAQCSDEPLSALARASRGGAAPTGGRQLFLGTICAPTTTASAADGHQRPVRPTLTRAWRRFDFALKAAKFACVSILLRWRIGGLPALVAETGTADESGNKESETIGRSLRSGWVPRSPAAIDQCA